MSEYKRIPVPGWEGYYEVDTNGSLICLPREYVDNSGRTMHRKERISRKVPSTCGYVICTLTAGKVRKNDYLHRLVCAAFHGLPPEGKRYVNHKNGVKTDNRPENLEWCDHSHNMWHSHNVLCSGKAFLGVFGADNPFSTPIVALDNSGQVAMRSAAIQEAGRAGFSPGNICSCIKGDRKSHRGFTWHLDQEAMQHKPQASLA